MKIIYSVAIAAVLASGAAGSSRPSDEALRFFEGRTETVTTVNPILQRSFRSRSIGQGEIKPDGSLELVQRVQDEGKPARERRWKVRQIAPGRFAGTMTDAKGLVVIDEVGNRYRFRFKTPDNLSVEQWLTPAAGGRFAQDTITIRKYGIVVARAGGFIRKLVD